MTDLNEEKTVCRMDDEGNQRCVLLFDELNRIDRRHIYNFCYERKRHDAELFLLNEALARQNELRIAARGSENHIPIANDTVKQWLSEFDHPSLFGK